jgi:hypothetical protein
MGSDIEVNGAADSIPGARSLALFAIPTWDPIRPPEFSRPGATAPRYLGERPEAELLPNGCTAEYNLRAYPTVKSHVQFSVCGLI